MSENHTEESIGSSLIGRRRAYSNLIESSNKNALKSEKRQDTQLFFSRSAFSTSLASFSFALY